MITIIAQNKNMALAIARATANDDEGNRHYYGSKFYITWLGHKPVEISTPRGQASYWFRTASFPNLPKYLTLSVANRTRQDGTSMQPDATAQVDVIKSLLAKSESIIVATYPTIEGEMEFRYLYSYLGCNLPCVRAIVNDLTIKTINSALLRTLPMEKFDKWYNTARYRDEADWFVGVNARRSLAFAAGRGTYQIGRTSASVLKMIADRNAEVKGFVYTESKYTTLVAKDSEGNIVCFRSIEPNSLVPKTTSDVNILAVEKTEEKIRTPKLFNLITLQVEAAKVFGMSPLRTYEAALALYNRKLISFPVAASTTVSQRKYQECRKVLAKRLSLSNFASVAMAGFSSRATRAVDKSSAMGTHGIVATIVPPLVLDDDMSRVYHLIVKRMYQAFSKEAVITRCTVTAECEGTFYRWSGEAYKSKGWHGLFKDTVMDSDTIPTFFPGEMASIFSTGSCTRNSVAPKPYTDATLIEGLLKARGMFQSDSIAKDIVHLETSGLIERDPWGYISLTNKGKLFYSIIKEMKIADISNVVSIDRLTYDTVIGKVSKSAFDNKVKQLASDITAELLASAKLFPRMEEDIPCPHCSTGLLKTFGRVAKCDNPECGHYIFRQYYGVTLDHSELKALAVNGVTPVIHGFRTQSGKTFKGQVVINAAGNPQVTSKSKSINS